MGPVFPIFMLVLISDLPWDNSESLLLNKMLLSYKEACLPTMKLTVQMSTHVPWPLALGNEECGFRESEWSVGPSKGILPFLTWSPQDLTNFKESFSRFKQSEHHRNPLQVAEAAQCRCWESCPRQLAGRSLASRLLLGNLHWNMGMNIPHIQPYQDWCLVMPSTQQV